MTMSATTMAGVVGSGPVTIRKAMVNRSKASRP
jgi:hypothetical protein